MTEPNTDRIELPVRDLRPEQPAEFDRPEHRPLPRDRRSTYFVEVE